MPTYNDARVRLHNDAKPNRNGSFVLYWMQAYRRFDHNHALDNAIFWARELKKPLVVYEGLRLDYPWSSARHHLFILEGMLDNQATAKSLGVNYWPFVETPEFNGAGLLRQIAESACLIVTDEYPAFIVPAQSAALAKRISIPLISVDGNSIVPLRNLGAAVSAAAHLRPRIHKAFIDAWANQASMEPDFSGISKKIEPPFPTWNLGKQSLAEFIQGLPIAQTVKAVQTIRGGTVAGKERLKRFIKKKLPNYAEGRNQPDDPEANAASGFSPYLHYGHLSIQEIVTATLESQSKWTPDQLTMSCRGKREGFFHADANINGFLDEAMTWRDVGYHWCLRKMEEKIRSPHSGKRPVGWKHPCYFDLETSIPAWAMQSLNKHVSDPRDHLYTLEEFENYETHDPLWNAAQKELVKTGKIHNYLRMLWGKKVLEWSETPQQAYLILEHLNNKYALDGRDPNSYTGILWTFGQFDRPWAPERKVFGVIRFMSSDNTAKKYKLQDYYQYVRGL
jgi:deoxyribodipyrimidine photo-lyase